MKLIFEKSREGTGCSILPPLDVPAYSLAAEDQRKEQWKMSLLHI